MTKEKKKLDIIWNITKICPWNCSICCVNSLYTSEKDLSKIKLDALKKEGIELSLETKLLIIDDLNYSNVKIDVSGGEPLIVPENMRVLKKLSEKFGRENLSISTTGKGLESVSIEDLSCFVSNIEFSYDFPYDTDPVRPFGYNSSNLRAISEVFGKRIFTTAQIPLMPHNIQENIIRKIYSKLSDVKVDRIFLMKFFQSGRATKREDLVLSDEEYSKAIQLYKKLDCSDGPKVTIQRVFKGMAEGIKPRSPNITSQGLFLLDSWAYDENGKPLKEYILGDLKTEKFSEIVKNNKKYKNLLNSM